MGVEVAKRQPDGKESVFVRFRMAWMSNACAKGLSIASGCLTANGISMI